MATRKRYVAVEQGPVKDAPATAATPQATAAELPPAAETPKPAEPLEVASPVEEAAKSALRQRLQEVERADQLSRQQLEEHRRVTQDAQRRQQPVDLIEQAIANLPERMKRWYQTYPELLTDPEKAAQIQYCHHVARREVGEEFTEPYFDRMEQMLGFKQEQKPLQPRPQPNGNGQGPPDPNRQHAAPRNAAPVQRQQYAGPPVSAPPTRDAPSMTTGRAPSEPMRLTNEELELARTLKLSPQEYAEGKKRLLREKGEGYHTDAGR